ncbi:unnamed protein product [Calypogeia fissa]
MLTLVETFVKRFYFGATDLRKEDGNWELMHEVAIGSSVRSPDYCSIRTTDSKKERRRLVWSRPAFTRASK